MEVADHGAELVTDADITNDGLEMAQVEALKYVLIARITCQAHTILRQDDYANGFAAYRKLAQYFEPDAESRNLQDMVQILEPEPMEEFVRKYPLWKAAYQTQLNCIGSRAALDDDVRKKDHLDPDVAPSR